jgi:NAD(P)H-hydrate epimerase
MIPIVTAEEMRRLDSAINAEAAMEKAAVAVALAVETYIYERRLPPRILLLAGVGNNGGDGFAAGALLLQRGFFVQAFAPHLAFSALCKKQQDRFLAQKGEVLTSLPGDDASYSLIIDALLGTGFHGKTEGPLASAIVWANNSHLPIFAVDIPSGLHATTGLADGPAICATKTVYLGFPKIGFFIANGYDLTGHLIPGDIGPLPKPQPLAQLLNPKLLKLPLLHRTRHKYSAGYVLGISGSPTMPGAAALAATATLRSGAGIVRLLTLAKNFPFPPEVIAEEYSPARFQEEVKRAKAVFVGPGLGRTTDVEKLLYQLLPSLSLPTVLDADALYFLAKNPSWTLPPHALLTPHHTEMERLLELPHTLPTCQHFVETHNTTLILKGAPTILFSPDQLPLINICGDCGMATAGTGDVLTGLLAGLLAQGLGVREAAILGVYLHGRAGELAASEWTSYSMIASDLIQHLSSAIKEFLP